MNRVWNWMRRLWQPVIGLALGVGLTLLVASAITALFGRTAPPVPDPRTLTATDMALGTREPVRPTSLPTPTPIARVQIVIAVQELPRGFRIPSNAVAILEWPAESVPFNVMLNIEDVVGKIARTDIFRQQPILANMLVDDFENLTADLGRVGSDLAAILPSNLVSVTVFVSALELPQGLQNGDRIDLIYTLPTDTTAEINEDGNLIDHITQRTVQDALVVHVGIMPANGRFIVIPPTPTPVPVEQAPDSVPPTPIASPFISVTGGLGNPSVVPITLGVTPEEAAYIIWARNAELPLTLVLRASVDTSQAQTRAMFAAEFEQQFGLILSDTTEPN